MARKHPTPIRMTPSERQKWLEDHVPHRIRAAIANSDFMYHAIEDIFNTDKLPAIQWRCYSNAIFEGRFCACRWLIEFVGVTMNKNGDTDAWQRQRTEDRYIGDIDGAVAAIFSLNTPEADKLARAWKACSQRSSHATNDYEGKLELSEDERQEVVDIIIEHLSKTIYANTPDWIQRYVLQPPAENS